MQGGILLYCKWDKVIDEKLGLKEKGGYSKICTVFKRVCLWPMPWFPDFCERIVELVSYLFNMIDL